MVTYGTEEWHHDIPICAHNKKSLYNYIIEHLDTDKDIIDFFATLVQPNDDYDELEDIENELERILLGYNGEDVTSTGSNFANYLKSKLSKKSYKWFFENLPIDIQDCNGRSYYGRISKIENIRYAK